MSAPDRKAMLDREHPELSMRRQCAMLGIARSGVYRLPRPANDDELALMRRIDALFTRWPFLGSRRMTAMLRAEGQSINRKRVRRLMRRMGIAALGRSRGPRRRRPDTRSFPTCCATSRSSGRTRSGRPISPTFRSGAASFTWSRSWIGASRAVLAWRLSNTMDVSFCVSALEEALARFGKPEIFNTDQGSQFTSADSPACWRRPGCDLDGWPRPMDGQHLHRAAVALALGLSLCFPEPVQTTGTTALLQPRPRHVSLHAAKPSTTLAI